MAFDPLEHVAHLVHQIMAKCKGGNGGTAHRLGNNINL
jgi:hypothetical protein